MKRSFSSMRSYFIAVFVALSAWLAPMSLAQACHGGPGFEQRAEMVDHAGPAAMSVAVSEQDLAFAASCRSSASLSGYVVSKGHAEFMGYEVACRGLKATRKRGAHSATPTRGPPPADRWRT